jgi:hypothetical protein
MGEGNRINKLGIPRRYQTKPQTPYLLTPGMFRIITKEVNPIHVGIK